MSLNWSIDKITKWQQVSVTEENGLQGWITESLIMKTLLVGLSSITKDNVDEWMWRLEHIGAVPTFHFAPATGLPEYRLTKADIERRIGLSTNADQLTRSRWLKLHKR